MGSLGAGAPPGGSGNAGFLENVQRAVAHWRTLVPPQGVPAAGPAMAGEAAELASVARSRGLLDVAGRLDLVARLANERSPGLAAAVGALAAHLQGPAAAAPMDRTYVMASPPKASAGVPATQRPVAPAGAPAPRPGEIALPPLLDEAPSPGGAGPSPKGGSPLPSLGETVVLSQRSAGVARTGVAKARNALPDSIVRPGAPQLLVKSMLNFRAFRKGDGAPPEEPPPPETAAKASSGLLGLGRKSRTPPPQAPELPSLAGGASGAGAAAARRGPSRIPPAAVRRSEVPAKASDPRDRRDSRAHAEHRVPPWVYLLGGGIGAIAVATVVVVVLATRHPVIAPSRGATVELDAAPATEGRLGFGAADLDAGGESQAVSIEKAAAVVHAQGEDTPQLRALLDLQSRMVSNCNEDPARCARGWARRSRDALEVVDAGTLLPMQDQEGPHSAWLQRLKIPHDFPLQDAQSLRGVFDYESKNIAGRQHFQTKIFDCAAYSDIFESTLLKYGAPTWLIAVVYQESSCNPLATSEVGARGLWQFMPESARAYGLRVVEDDVDERLNPVKSTEAAIHFLTDLQRKLGAWDLALAAYNMGPFAVTMRIAQVGGHAGFWDLQRAGLLPDETAAYVPAIEAHALILENLSRLQFGGNYGKPLESTAEIAVKAGTRLSLIARAAATSTIHIRELNPEFLRDVVPDGEVTARVPDAEAHRAQTFIDSHAPEDEKDLCVPEDFNWGAKLFETSKYAATCTHLAGPVAH
jgi:Transglycosylase SLT domain